MSQPNRVMIALTSIVAGAAGGGAIAAAFVWAAWQQWQFLNVFGDLANTVFIGWGIGAIVAFALSWRTSGPIIETWRRAAMGVTAGMGAVGCGGAGQGIAMASMMSMSSLANYWTPGLVVLLALIAAVAFVVNRKHRAAAAL
jgi:hypothetical protein